MEPPGAVAQRGLQAGDALARAAKEEAARGTFAPVISTFPLKRVQEAVLTLEGGRVDGRVVLRPERLTAPSRGTRAWDAVRRPMVLSPRIEATGRAPRRRTLALAGE